MDSYLSVVQPKPPLGERGRDAPQKSWEKQLGRASEAQGNLALQLAPIETEFPTWQGDPNLL